MTLCLTKIDSELGISTCFSDSSITKYEKTIPMFMAFGMGCVGCLAAKGESVEQAAAVHNIDVDFLIEKLNEVAE